ncbi:MAG: DUF1846 family protein, partial [Eubacterium sp.]|nr:DUF1846 family protein [Eubacterium sp.]
KVYRHYPIKGYPSDLKLIVSDDGYGRNDYIQTTRPLVVVTAPGPGSGKMATCLSQLYHEHKRGVSAGYAKFETFPVWNLPLSHPVNLAYEAATADLNDVNMIDPYHLEAYGKTCVNYNRDVEIFRVLDAIFKQIFGSSFYKSPTDMGVNMVGFCISDDEAVRKASEQEILRRYYQVLCDRRKGNCDDAPVYKLELLMKQAGLTISDRPCVAAANVKAQQTGQPAAAIEMADGTIIAGKTSHLLGASSSMLIKAMKYLAGIDQEIKLLSPSVIEPIMVTKRRFLGSDERSLLHLNELLIALSVAATSDENARRALDHLDRLKGLEAHCSVILSQIDMDICKKIGINMTCEPQYEGTQLYHK